MSSGFTIVLYKCIIMYVMVHVFWFHIANRNTWRLVGLIPGSQMIWKVLGICFCFFFLVLIRVLGEWWSFKSCCVSQDKCEGSKWGIEMLLGDSWGTSGDQTGDNPAHLCKKRCKKARLAPSFPLLWHSFAIFSFVLFNELLGYVVQAVRTEDVSPASPKRVTPSPVYLLTLQFPF